jgi:hypothetical protein
MMGACSSVAVEMAASGRTGDGGATATGGAGGGASSTTASSSGGSCETHCSDDLHTILDCHDQVVTTCPPDQGCGPDGCVPACDSAIHSQSNVGCDFSPSIRT